MAFQLEEYGFFLNDLSKSGRKIRTVADYLAAPDRKSIVLRHDVDRRVERSIAIARLERENNIAASYYFRYRKGFPIAAVRNIYAMGHEVGFHYETFSDSKGNSAIATKMFLDQLREFREIKDCLTVCAHGRPLNKWFSGDMASCFLDSAHGLIGDASESMPSDMLFYLTDAGGKWNDNAVNLRDKIGVMPVGVNPLDKKSLALLLSEEKTLYINTHPERWVSNMIGLVEQSTLEIITGMVKLFLRKLRA